MATMTTHMRVLLDSDARIAILICVNIVPEYRNWIGYVEAQVTQNTIFTVSRHVKK